MNVNEMVERLRESLYEDGCVKDGRGRKDELAAADMLAGLLARAEAAERRLDVYNSGGFKDADALAERFISLTAERDELREENERLRGALHRVREYVVGRTPYGRQHALDWIDAALEPRK
jgi:chromosome segregation ATPase